MHPKRVSPKILRQQAQGGLPSGLRKQDERWMLTRLNKLYKLARKAGFNNPEQLELIGENVNFGGFFTHPILMPTSSQFRTALRDLKRQRRKFLHHKAKFVLASTNKDTIPLKEWFNDALAERDFMNSLDVFNVTPMYGKVRKLVKASAGSSFMDSLNGVTLTSISGKARKLAKASSGRKGDRMTEAFSVIIILLILALLMRQAARKPTIREERLIGPIIEEVQAAVCETQPLIQDLNQTYNITNFHQAENLTKLNVGNLSVEVKDCPGYKNFDNKIPTLSWNLPFKTSYTLEGSNLNFTHALDKNETLNTTSEVVKWLEFQQLVREYREAVKLQKNTYTYRKELKVVGGKMAHLISEERISRRNLPDLKELVNLSHGFSQNLTYLSRWFTIADSSSKAGYFNRTLLEIIEPNIGKVSMETRNFTSNSVKKYKQLTDIFTPEVFKNLTRSSIFISENSSLTELKGLVPRIANLNSLATKYKQVIAIHDGFYDKTGPHVSISGRNKYTGANLSAAIQNATDHIFFDYLVNKYPKVLSYEHYKPGPNDYASILKYNIAVRLAKQPIERSWVNKTRDEWRNNLTIDVNSFEPWQYDLIESAIKLNASGIGLLDTTARSGHVTPDMERTYTLSLAFGNTVHYISSPQKEGQVILEKIANTPKELLNTNITYEVRWQNPHLADLIAKDYDNNFTFSLAGNTYAQVYLHTFLDFAGHMEGISNVHININLRTVAYFSINTLRQLIGYDPGEGQRHLIERLGPIAINTTRAEAKRLGIKMSAMGSTDSFIVNYGRMPADSGIRYDRIPFEARDMLDKVALPSVIFSPCQHGSRSRECKVFASVEIATALQLATLAEYDHVKYAFPTESEYGKGHLFLKLEKGTIILPNEIIYDNHLDVIRALVELKPTMVQYEIGTSEGTKILIRMPDGKSHKITVQETAQDETPEIMRRIKALA